jgi:hypothetical protein
MEVSITVWTSKVGNNGPESTRRTVLLPAFNACSNTATSGATSPTPIAAAVAVSHHGAILRRWRRRLM